GAVGGGGDEGGAGHAGGARHGATPRPLKAAPAGRSAHGAPSLENPTTAVLMPAAVSVPEFSTMQQRRRPRGRPRKHDIDAEGELSPQQLREGQWSKAEL